MYQLKFLIYSEWLQNKASRSLHQTAIHDTSALRRNDRARQGKSKGTSKLYPISEKAQSFSTQLRMKQLSTMIQGLPYVYLIALPNTYFPRASFPACGV